MIALKSDNNKEVKMKTLHALTFNKDTYFNFNNNKAGQICKGSVLNKS